MLTEKLTPKELVLKHIFNKNHVVTEEEFLNLKVGFLNSSVEELEKSEEQVQLSQTLVRQ